MSHVYSVQLIRFLLIFASLSLVISSEIDLTETQASNDSTTDSKQSNFGEVTTYNDFLSYLFGTQYDDQVNSTDAAKLPSNDTDNSQNNTQNSGFECISRDLNTLSNQTIQVQLITLPTKSYIPLISESNIDLANKNNECVLLLLYFDWCPHSIKIAPFFNAIGRAYPQLHVIAMDSYQHNGVNLRLSLFGVPSIVMIQKDRIIARFNETEIDLKTLEEFITKTTSFKPIHDLEVNDEDRVGPVPTKVTLHFNYIMLVCLTFFFITFVYFAYNRLAHLYAHLLEYICSTWLESQRGHEHSD